MHTPNVDIVVFVLQYKCVLWGIIVVVMISNLFKVSSGLLTQVVALLCKAQGRQVVRNSPVLMAVMEMTQTLVSISLFPSETE